MRSRACWSSRWPNRVIRHELPLPMHLGLLTRMRRCRERYAREMSESAPTESKSIFVISPIGSAGTPEHRRYRLTLDYIVKKAFFAPDWEVVRADDETSPDSITTQVIGRIVESDLIIADLTDHNPNVFYELAVAHGYQKRVIHMMEEGQKVPFDVVDQRVIFYDLADPESVDNARTGLINSAKWLDDNPGQARNPLSAHGQFSAISSASGGGADGRAVAEALESLSGQVARLGNRLPRRESTREGLWVPKAVPEGAGAQALQRLLDRERSLLDELDVARSSSLPGDKVDEVEQRLKWSLDKTRLEIQSVRDLMMS